MSTHTPGPYGRITPTLKDGSLYAARRDIERLEALNADLLAVLQQAISSRWLSIDLEHNRTKEACDIRAAICAAIAKAEGVS